MGRLINLTFRYDSSALTVVETEALGRSRTSAALQKLETAADSTGITLYQANLRTYQLLRYGVPVQIAVGQAHETVHLIDWEHPERNDFALAEEVTLKGGATRADRTSSSISTASPSR